MTIKSIITVLLSFFLVVISADNVFSQAALNAPPEDSVYLALDTFIAHGLVKDVIIGQRPFSRLEIARILKITRKSLEEAKTIEGDYDLKRFSHHLMNVSYIDKLLSYYEKDYSRELEGMRKGVEFDILRRLDYTVLYNSSKPRRIPISNGQGSIDGIATSFDENGQGITYADGMNSFLSTQHDLYLSKYFAFTVQPRFEFYIPGDGDEKAFEHIHRLYVKTGISNFEVEVGRDNLLWGQSEYGGLMVSSNARPLDMLKISNPYPLKLPWIFKYLGPMKWTLFVSNLGPEYNFPYAYFYGLKWSLKPHRCFELGLSHTIITAGRGAPKLSFWDPLTELLPFQKWGGANIGASDIANNAFGFLDFRVTIPPLRNSVLYYDGYIEDSVVRAFRLPDNLLKQMGFIVGWYSPRLTSKGDIGLRLEYHHVAPLDYRHSSRWIYGYTLNERVIGDPLGPDADGIYSTIYWRPKPKFLARLDLAFEDYDSSTYKTEVNSEGGGDRILKDVAGPHERRYRAVAAVDWLGNERFGIKFSAGYERIQNWNFEVGRSVDNILLGAMLSLRFKEFMLKSD